jgi:hypothetical protein
MLKTFIVVTKGPQVLMKLASMYQLLLRSNRRALGKFKSPSERGHAVSVKARAVSDAAENGDETSDESVFDLGDVPMERSESECEHGDDSMVPTPASNMTVDYAVMDVELGGGVSETRTPRAPSIEPSESSESSESSDARTSSDSSESSESSEPQESSEPHDSKESSESRDAASTSSESSTDGDESDASNGRISDAALNLMVCEFYQDLVRGETDCGTERQPVRQRGRMREDENRARNDDSDDAAAKKDAARQVWAHMGGTRPFERACAVLRQEGVHSVSVTGTTKDLTWLDPRRGWAATLLVKLIRAPDDDVRLHVSVVDSHFLRRDADDADADARFRRERMPSLAPTSLWSRRRVRSRFALADERLFDVLGSFRWNRAANAIVVEALRRWKRIHDILKACAVCGRLLASDNDVLCSTCAARQECSRWLGNDHDACRSVTSFSMREVTMLSYMDMHSTLYRSDDDDVEDMHCSTFASSFDVGNDDE